MSVRPLRRAIAEPVVHVVGARPNFIKMAPLIEALDRRGVADQVVVHTGQHYDRRMSEEILEDLGFPVPDYSLGVGSGSHGEQTGKVLIAFEEILISIKPGVVVVAGDVNSTLACALAASKLGIPVVHLEAGLRSGDWTMPEEINRVLTDRLSNLLLTHSPEAEENLAREGVDVGRVRFVGNTMIDSLRRFEGVARDRAVWDRHGVRSASTCSLRCIGLRTSMTPPPCRDRQWPVPAGHGSTCPFPGAPAYTGTADGSRRPSAPGKERSALLGSRRLPRFPLAAGRCRNDRHRFGRRSGGSVRAGRPVLHAAGQHRATDHDQPRHQRPAR